MCASVRVLSHTKIGTLFACGLCRWIKSFFRKNIKLSKKNMLSFMFHSIDVKIEIIFLFLMREYSPEGEMKQFNLKKTRMNECYSIYVLYQKKKKRNRLIGCTTLSNWTKCTQRKMTPSSFGSIELNKFGILI